ncbi:metalloprotease [Candidatus Woesearchaeota archaeon]|nr:metalloprotease [Candidatus Woesearchaeota archaeon]
MLSFSRFEIKEIVKAWVLVSLMFAIAKVGIGARLPWAIVVALITAGVGFLLHELAHKFVAQRYQCWAEFRANDQALLIGVLLSFTGFILAAPGGVFIRGASHRQHGWIALAGPMMNVLLAVLFFFSAGFLPTDVALYGYYINALLGVFNLIPFPPFDGAAVWQWNKAVYVVSIALAGLVFVISLV